MRTLIHVNGAKALSIMTRSIQVLFSTLSVNASQHNDSLHNNTHHNDTQCK